MLLLLVLVLLLLLLLLTCFTPMLLVLHRVKSLIRQSIHSSNVTKSYKVSA